MIIAHGSIGEIMNKIDRHFQTAKLLLEGIEESMQTWDKERTAKGWYAYANSATEHSKESVVRRLIQTRQELLQVIKELK